MPAKSPEALARRKARHKVYAKTPRAKALAAAREAAFRRRRRDGDPPAPVFDSRAVGELLRAWGRRPFVG